MEQIISSGYLQKNQIIFAKLLDQSLNNKNSHSKISIKIAGKLQHAYFGMPGIRGLFRPIQKSMDGIPLFIILKPSIKKVLSGWHSIVTQISTQPTSVLQLVQYLP